MRSFQTRREWSTRKEHSAFIRPVISRCGAGLGFLQCVGGLPGRPPFSHLPSRQAPGCRRSALAYKVVPPFEINPGELFVQNRDVLLLAKSADIVQFPSAVVELAEGKGGEVACFTRIDVAGKETVPGTCQALVWHVPGTCVALVWHLCGTCPAPVWHVPGTCRRYAVVVQPDPTSLPTPNRHYVKEGGEHSSLSTLHTQPTDRSCRTCTTFTSSLERSPQTSCSGNGLLQ
jgi:hypothetical protein